jgi:hypothetical protein
MRANVCRWRKRAFFMHGSVLAPALEFSAMHFPQ